MDTETSHRSCSETMGTLYVCVHTDKNISVKINRYRRALIGQDQPVQKSTWHRDSAIDVENHYSIRRALIDLGEHQSVYERKCQ